MPVYRLWDACMNNLSEGVLTYSQTGDRSILTRQLIAQAIAGNRLDDVQASAVSQGSDSSTDEFVIDKYNQYVSVISRQVPSPDYIVGVADLQLCDGDKWRETVKVCMELFSTGANSEGVADEMERNSVQANNCSFGYIEFNLKEISVSCCQYFIAKQLPFMTLFMYIYLHSFVQFLRFNGCLYFCQCQIFTAAI